MKNEALTVLLVEDNPGDVELVKEGLSEAKSEINLFVVEDGVDAISFLRKEARFHDVPCPDLVLLDINLPRKNGHEVLRDIRQDPNLTMLPVVIFTTSDHYRDVVQGYEQHVSAYVTKPASAQEFTNAIKVIAQFWLSLAKLPTRVAS